MNVLGLKIRSHDTGAALISNEKVVAIAEERLCRIKHSNNVFPKLAIQYCLREFNLKPEDIDLVVIDQVDRRETWPMKKWFLEEVEGDFSKARIEVINHHAAHAASAFFASPFDDAAVLVYDGSGEKFVTHLGVLANETESLYKGVGNKMELLQKTVHLQESKRFPFTYGIGKLYQRLSENYLDFGKYNEGKMMGLAPYGNDSVLKQIPMENWFAERNGEIFCNARFSYPARSTATRLSKAKNIGSVFFGVLVLLRLKVRHVLRKASQVLGAYHYGYVFAEPTLFPKIRLPKPARSPEDKLPDTYYASVAYLGQKVLEEVAVRWGRRLKSITGAKNLCIAGGVGLNIDANRNFLDVVGFEKLFVQPASSDTGIALGCALYGYHVILDKPRFFVMHSAALGHTYSDSDIEKALDERKDEIVVTKSEHTAKEAAKLLADGKILAWHQGGAEYGPRALGNRSIIVDARKADMKDILNDRVKHRESWRPFAASILRESLSEWFELETESPATAFMLLAAPVKMDKRSRVPSIVHVDGTCRMQTLTKEANGRYYDLVKEFETLTGVPLILNTSFNLGGDPIVETPADSLDTFLATNIDYLVIEDYLVAKKK